jgi:hypothetical protein
VVTAVPGIPEAHRDLDPEVAGRDAARFVYAPELVATDAKQVREDLPLEHLLRPHACYRVQAEIGQKHFPLDDIDPTTLKTMRDAAAKLIAERDRDFDAICERLLAGTA